MVNPRLPVRHPSLSQIDNGDLIHSVDFRSVYAAMLDGWMKCDSRNVLGRSFKPADVLSSAV